MRCHRAAALLALAMLPALAACSAIRGLDPALASRYQPTADGQFQCLDGKKSVPFSQVNDDYCDCLDGSDEPGTSACPNGRFYCANKLFLPLVLNATMVDDGVCDCCDGSDEPAGRCPNTCQQQGWESLVDLRNQVETSKAGVEQRNKYMAEAAASKAQWQQRKAEVDAELEGRRKEADELEAVRNQLEDESRRLSDKKAELQEKQRKMREDDLPPPVAPEDGADVAGADVAGGDAGADADAAAAAEAAEQAEQAEPVAKTEEELARERMAQWIPGAGKQDADVAAGDADVAAQQHEPEEPPPTYDNFEPLPDVVYDEADQAAAEAAQAAAREQAEQVAAAAAAAGASNDDDSAESGQEGGEQFFHDGGDAAAAAGGGAGGADGDDAGAAAGPGTEEAAGQEPATAVGKAKKLFSSVLKALKGGDKKAGSDSEAPAKRDPAEDAALTAEIAKLDDELDAVDAVLEPARKKATDARDKVRDLEEEQRSLERKLEGSYGEGDAFVALVDRCFDANVDKYTYSVCPFDKAEQKEGHSATSLGTWSGLAEGETHMRFENGQSCWQGPARSMTVSLKCGQKERLAKVEEPSRCEYTAELETPAACTPAAFEALQAELERRQRLMDGAGASDEAGAGDAPKDEL